jgi:hypothetical protein
MKSQITALFVSLSMMLGFCESVGAQSITPTSGVSTASASGSLIPLVERLNHPIYTPNITLGAETALSYFDNTLPAINFGVATIGNYTVYALGERMTLPTSAGFVDSVHLTLAAATGDSVAIMLFPDTLYQTADGLFHLINIVDPNALPYAVAWVPAAAINGPTNITITYPHVAVPQNFFVVVSANVNTSQLMITSQFTLVGDSKPVVPRTTGNARSAFLAFIGTNANTSLFDSTFTNSQTGQPIYSDWEVTTYVQTAQGSVALNSGNDDGIRVFPNPATSHLSISAPSGFENGTVELRDMLGRLAIQSTQLNGESLDLRGLAPGRYEAVVRSPSGVMTAPVSIQR